MRWRTRRTGTRGAGTRWILAVWLVGVATIVGCTSLNDCGCDGESWAERPGLLTGASTSGKCKGDDCLRAHVCEKPTMISLAKDLDFLDRHIDEYGTVVAKVPDVWGQARLTKYRQAFEAEMAKDYTAFAKTLQGSIQRTDQAFLASALSLSAAISGSPATLGQTDIVGQNVEVSTNRLVPDANDPTKLTRVNEKVTNPMGIKRELVADPFDPKKKMEVTETTTPIRGERIKPLDATDPATLIDSAGVIKRNDAVLSQTFGFAKEFKEITLEPTIVLDQKARYLRHLDEIRRINEGDDTADSAGYGLHLVRIPVSVLPGKKTRIGYGAEITMSLDMQIGAEFLPETFRNLVRNDIVDQLSTFFTVMLNDVEMTSVLEDWQKEREKQNKQELSFWAYLDGTAGTKIAEFAGANQKIPVLSYTRSLSQTPVLTGDLTSKQESITKVRTFLAKVSGTKIRRAQQPFPPSQLSEIYGEDRLFNALGNLFLAYKQDLRLRKTVHYQNIQGLLQEEVAAAYKLLADPQHQSLWNYCSPDLVSNIRGRNQIYINDQRTKVLCQLNCGATEKMGIWTHDLAWAVIVESALLNDKLELDMREVFSAKGGPTLAPAWHFFYLPTPPLEDRQFFEQYVRTRFPIHVFALDPETQDQNLADTYSRRREMQLALSLAFVTGRMNARSLTRYMRRLEGDFQTIDLNRTAVGYAHGPDCFGWRFYPRFQTPDVESNATVLFRDLLWGGPNKDADLRHRRLEPGPRECVALVIMPSFVPYATMNVSSNWFRLTNPRHKEFTTTDTVRLSKVVKSVQTCSPNTVDINCYRDGEFARLLQRCKQLEARLPLQTLAFQVPYENTLGGFGLFNSGVTDLVPELRGFYGAPGIDRKQPTVLFLIGDHFSVNNTRVIAGGLEVKEVELLSRQIMKVVIPAGTAKLDSNEVDLHLATPYGATQRLSVPIVPETPPAPAKPDGLGFRFDTPKLDVTFSAKMSNTASGVTFEYAHGAPPLQISLNSPDAKSWPAIRVSIEFPRNQLGMGDDPKIQVDLKDPTQGVYLDPEASRTIALEILKRVNTPNVLPYTWQMLPEKLPEYVSAKVKVTPLREVAPNTNQWEIDPNGQPVLMLNNLTVVVAIQKPK